MKYLYNEPHTRQFLQSWVQKKPLITAGFFFWNSGTDMQMSQMGLMQTLLYESLQRISAQENSQEIFKNLLADRWDEYEAFGGGIHPFTLSEIYRVFDRLLSDVSRCFFLVIDGLDEFDGNSRDLIRLIMSMSRHGNVKICTASRPWLVFEDAFSNRPNLLLEQLTEEDIRLYITSNFNQNAHFVSLMRYESLFAHALIANVVTKAQGVFLWVYLVVESLLEGISNADRMSDLQSRLDSLPSDLEDLFDKLLGRLDQIYFAQACQFFLLLKEHPSPSLLQLSFADDDDTTSSMKANVQPLRPEEALIRMRVTSRRLRSRCKGLLEVYYEGSGETRIKVSREALNSHFKLMKTDRDSPQDLTSFKVGYLHRTARDYLHSPRVWEIICEATANTSFDAQESWANCFLWCLKTIRPIDNISSVKWELWDPLSWCMEYALRLQERDGKTRLTYLDEVSKAFEQDRESVYRRGQLLETTYDAPRESFVSVAAALSFNDYVRVKLKTMSRAERKGFSKSRLNRLIRDAYTANSQLPGRQKLWHKIQCQIILGSNKDVEYYRRSSWRRAIMLKPNGKPVEFV
jgi:hypothetical protein